MAYCLMRGDGALCLCRGGVSFDLSLRACFEGVIVSGRLIFLTGWVWPLCM